MARPRDAQQAMGGDALTTEPTELQVRVPNSFMEYLSGAIVRLSYLHPELSFDETRGGLIISGEVCSYDEVTLRQEIFNQLYRERIYTETLSIRRWINSD